MFHRLIAPLLAILVVAPLWAGEAVTYTSPDDFDDTVFSVENAILDAGLVIDLTSHTGDMLERTRPVTGSDVVLFEHADIFSFCSATVSRKVMEADIMNIVHCPYRIFVMQQAGTDQVIVGFKSMPEGVMKEVEALLDGIVKDALGL
ncbi:DUF302 domain-containing protein [Profundibacter sp.]|uniref:DUF302 domain-containing protein n=1 Tax=Profundibacter sp. TaxID=3101071 RepID=UPI003D107532